MWSVYPVQVCYDTRWPTGLLSTQAKVEGTVSRAAWHWRGDSVVNDPHGEPGRTFSVVLSSAWGPADGDCMFSPHFVGWLILGTPIVINE